MKREQFLSMLILCCLTGCSANPTTAPDHPVEPARTAATAALAPASGNTLADAQAAATTSRFLFVLFDSSQSYALYDSAIRKACAMVNGMGPGDRLVIARMGERFRPETNIKLQARMPEILAELLVPSTRLVEWREKQANVNSIWQQVEERRLEISAYLTNHLSGKNTAAVTDLWGALDYCAQRFRGESASEKYLIIFSDLDHDFDKQKTSQPPVQRLEFQRVHARLLYVPWTANWAGLQRDWGAWFKRAGVADFVFLDSGQSDQAVIVTPARKPELRSPFGKS